MAEKRKRGQNFTLEEKDRLVKLLREYKNTILNKKTDGTTNEAKSKAWISLTESFNTTGTIYRSRDSLMKMWEKLKSESKIYYTASRKNAIQTGGGPSTIKIDPILEQICAILGRGCTGIIGVQDSDSTEEVFSIDTKENSQELPKVICIDLPINTNIEFQDVESHENVEIPNEEVINTPLWSRRRPQLSQPNERTEAMGTLCNSFKEVNKSKKELEELKRHLLQDEIDFKKKLYDLQLQSTAKDVEIKNLQPQSAAKEYEIKNEILLQIKGGGLPLQHLFEAQQKHN